MGKSLSLSAPTFQLCVLLSHLMTLWFAKLTGSLLLTADLPSPGPCQRWDVQEEAAWDKGVEILERQRGDADSGELRHSLAAGRVGKELSRGPGVRHTLGIQPLALRNVGATS